MISADVLDHDDSFTIRRLSMPTLRRLAATELMSFSLIHDLNSLTAKAADTPEQKRKDKFSFCCTLTEYMVKTNLLQETLTASWDRLNFRLMPLHGLHKETRPLVRTLAISIWLFLRSVRWISYKIRTCLMAQCWGWTDTFTSLPHCHLLFTDATTIKLLKRSFAGALN